MPAEALVGMIGIAVLLWVFYGPWQMVCTDSARLKLFIYRDELFDMAARHEISFDSVEYREVREMMNSLIRYAHRLTVPRLFVVYVFPPKNGISSADIYKRIDSIGDQVTREKVRNLFNSSMRTVFIMMGQKSPLTLLGFLLAFIAWKLVSLVAQNQFQRLRSFYHRLRDIGRVLILNETLCSDL